MSLLPKTVQEKIDADTPITLISGRVPISIHKLARLANAPYAEEDDELIPLAQVNALIAAAVALIPAGVGDIKSDGSVNFTAAETWLAAPDYTEVAPTVVTIGDGIDVTLISKTTINVQDGSSTATIEKTGFSVNDGVDVSSLAVGGVYTSDGLVGTPSHTFTNQLDMGMYLVSAVQLGVAVSGTLVGGFDASGLFTGTISEQVATVGVTIDGVLCKDSNVKTGLGLVTETAVGPAGDPNTGIYFDGADEMSLAVGGIDAFHITTTYCSFSGILAGSKINLMSDPGVAATGGIFYEDPSNRFVFSIGGLDVYFLTDAGWTLPTGTPLKAGFDADVSTTASAGYVQAEVQAINDALVEMRQSYKALMDHLMTNMKIFVI